MKCPVCEKELETGNIYRHKVHFFCKDCCILVVARKDFLKAICDKSFSKN